MLKYTDSSDILKYTDSEINLKIIEERNKEIEELTEEFEDLSEISLSLHEMLKEQGEFIDEMDKTMETSSLNVEEGTKSLKISLQFMNKARKTIKNVAIVIGGLSLGALGFIAGPIIGAATTASGIAAGLGVVAVTNKTNKNK